MPTYTIDEEKTNLLSLDELDVLVQGDPDEYHAVIKDYLSKEACHVCFDKNSVVSRGYYPRSLHDIIPSWVCDSRCQNPSIRLRYNEKKLYCNNCKKAFNPEVTFIEKSASSTNRFNLYVCNLAIKQSYGSIRRKLNSVIPSITVKSIFDKWIQDYEENHQLAIEAKTEMAILNLTIGGVPSNALIQIEDRTGYLFDVWPVSAALSDGDSPLKRIKNPQNARVIWIEHDCPFYNEIVNTFSYYSIKISKERFIQSLKESLINLLGHKNLTKKEKNLIFADCSKLSEYRKQHLASLMAKNSDIQLALNICNEIRSILYNGGGEKALDNLKKQYSTNWQVQYFFENDVYPYFDRVCRHSRDRFSEDIQMSFKEIKDQVEKDINKNCKFEAVRARMLYANELLNDFRRILGDHYILSNNFANLKFENYMTASSNSINNRLLATFYRWNVTKSYQYKETDANTGASYYKGIPLWLVLDNLKRIEIMGIRQGKFYWDVIPSSPPVYPPYEDSSVYVYEGNTSYSYNGYGSVCTYPDEFTLRPVDQCW